MNACLNLSGVWLDVDFCGSKNAHKKDTCLKKIGIYVQTLSIILTSSFNIIEKMFMIIQIGKEPFTLTRIHHIHLNSRKE